MTHPKINALSVAVVIDNEVSIDAATNKTVTKPLNQDKISKITDLVKATIGYDEKRGDRVTVVNSSFIPLPKDIPAPPPHFWDQVWFWDVLKKIIGSTLGFVLLFILYKKLASYMKSSPQVPQRLILKEEDDEDMSKLTKELHELKQTKMNKLKELASRDPNRVALIMKNWVGK